ncbi:MULTISPECIES: helix-turn-helix domain-containing protein [Acidobacteriaceae]|uniref:helix-turn-helix domain-containing protein n=1 Tax=Acidobacteriaceae TaxID=204434 RepID=UPI00131C1316|nr:MULTISPECIES: helix-turn-helix domain-containing protein [Acidobacteriaceae]MDW5266925.1 helix-turn-helix domain-containing protein [Edaphobacter sp.]
MVTLLGLAFKGGPTNSSDLLLYLALADHANEDGACYPSVERLAMWCRQDSRNTRRNMPKLARAGWVKVVKVGRRKEYVLDVPKLCLSALESGIKLSSEELSFLARKIPGKMSAMEQSATPSTPDNMSAVTTASAHSTPDKMSAIQPSIPDIHVARYRTFTSSIPDIDVTNTGHSRHPYREPLRTVIEPSRGTVTETNNSPATVGDTSETTLAKAMLERLAIISTDKILRLAAEAIRLQAGALATTAHKAMLLIERQASLSQERGEPVNSFWFEDSKWKGAPSPAAVGVYQGDDKPAEVEAESAPEGVDTELGARIWTGMNKALKSELGIQSYETWIKPIKPLGAMNGELYLQIPSPDFAHVADRYDIASFLPAGVEQVHLLSATGAAA